MIKNSIFSISFLIFQQIISAQVNPDIEKINNELRQIEEKKDALLEQLEFFTLREDIKEVSQTIIPKDNEIIKHNALIISYNEDHEQANWVAHKINKKIIDGNVSRTNNFIVDTLISSGSSEEKDYFLKSKLPSGKYTYDGYGYDRGHLAPSADFKWSKTALSESYYYSNMSPQLPEFNRKGWAKIEGFLRGYVYDNNIDLYVITGPLYNTTIKKSERSVNGLSVPDYFFKIAIDLKNNLGIAFLVPHEKLSKPLESYMVSIDSIENLSGFDFNYQLKDDIEKAIEEVVVIEKWQNKKIGEMLLLYPAKSYQKACTIPYRLDSS